jgi:hypothetical protein
MRQMQRPCIKPAEYDPDSLLIEPVVRHDFDACGHKLTRVQDRPLLDARSKPRGMAVVGGGSDVPAGAHSIRFLTNTWPNNNLHMTFAGQPIPLMAMSSQSGVTEVGGDISAYAGTTGLLKMEQFRNPEFSPVANYPIDEISFSAQPVPEPGMVFFTALLFAAFVRL